MCLTTMFFLVPFQAKALHGQQPLVSHDFLAFRCVEEASKGMSNHRRLGR
jgi:hypothetical protein